MRRKLLLIGVLISSVNFRSHYNRHPTIFFSIRKKEQKKVGLIREVVEQAINTGYLTVEAEEQLRLMLKNKYELEDLEAFIELQQAAMIGQVKQESRELLYSAQS